MPLPLISYGGTAMMALMIGFGLMLSFYVHRDVMAERRHADEDILRTTGRALDIAAPLC